jgi:hypothetical protein
MKHSQQDSIPNDGFLGSNFKCVQYIHIYIYIYSNGSDLVIQALNV